MVLATRAQGWAVACLLACCTLTAVAFGQTPVPPAMNPPPAESVLALPPAQTPQSAGGSGQTQGASAGSGSSTSSSSCSSCQPTADGYWSKVPPTQRYPLPGYFIVFPTGEGYYSLLDVVEDNERQNAPKYPYPRFSIDPFPFFEADWRYLDKSDNKEHDFFDCLKRIRLFDDAMLLTIGGEERIRNAQEKNSRLSGVNNDYTLERTRLYVDLMITNRFRIYVEFLDAQAFGESLAPLPTDIDHADFMNAFFDVALFDVNEDPVWFRFGRQELCYGSQRLVSPLDWANARRTFEGAKLFWQHSDFRIDAFCVSPVIPNPGRLDSWDNNQVFSGLWTTWRPNAGRQEIDLYYLNLDHAGRAYAGAGGVVSAGNISTTGARWAGQEQGWLWDCEGMLQFGTYSNQNLFAGSFTVSGGYEWKDLPMTPQFWLGYDFASGTDNPNTGNTHSTFQQLFPFGHYYFGYIDVVGRQNIHDIQQQFTFFPTRWITVLMQNHVFNLDSPTDALYNASGNAIRQDKTGRSGSYVGDEIDLVVNFHLTTHQDVLIGYSHLYSGRYLETAPALNAGPGSNSLSLHKDPDYFYVQYSYKW